MQRAEQLLKSAETEKRDLTTPEEGEWNRLHRTSRNLDERMSEIVNYREREAYLEPRRQRLGNAIRTDASTRRGDFRPNGQHRAGEWLANEIRALTGAGTTGGGAFTPSDNKSEFFDLLAAQSVFLKSGARQIRTERDSVVVPHLLTDTAANWTSEAAPIPQKATLQHGRGNRGSSPSTCAPGGSFRSTYPPGGSFRSTYAPEPR